MFDKIKNKYNDLPKIVKASLWFFLCSFLQKGISTITVPIFTRLLPQEDYGQYNVFNSWFSIFSVFVTLNLYGGIYTQNLVKHEDNRNEYISSMQGLSFVLVFCWTIIYSVFKTQINIFTGLTDAQMYMMLLMMWTTSIFNYWAMEQRVKLNYVFLVVVTIAVALLKPILGIFLVINSDDKVTARIFGLVLVEATCYSWMFVSHLIKGKRFFDIKTWVSSLRLAIPLIPHYLSQVVLNSADRIMIERMIGKNESAIYSLAFSISTIMVLVNTVLLQTIDPWIFQKIKEKKIKDVERVSYMVLLIVAVMNIFVMAFSPEIISVFAPSAYAEAVWVIPPLTMSLLFMFAYNLFSEFEFYYEKTSLISFVTVVVAIINVTLNYFFLKMFGYVAAGYTTLLCYFLYALFHFICMRKICRKEETGLKPFSIKILLLFTVLYILIGFAFLVSYVYIVIRIVLISLLITVLVIFRKKIKVVFSKLINIRKKVE